MSHPDDLPLPFPPDAQELSAMRVLQDNGGAIASKGTDNFALLEKLAERGYLRRHYCPKATGVFHFQLSRAGQEAIQ